MTNRLTLSEQFFRDQANAKASGGLSTVLNRFSLAARMLASELGAGVPPVAGASSPQKGGVPDLGAPAKPEPAKAEGASAPQGAQKGERTMTFTNDGALPITVAAVTAFSRSAAGPVSANSDGRAEIEYAPSARPPKRNSPRSFVVAESGGAAGDAPTRWAVTIASMRGMPVRSTTRPPIAPPRVSRTRSSGRGAGSRGSSAVNGM